MTAGLFLKVMCAISVGIFFLPGWRSVAIAAATLWWSLGVVLLAGT
jgi:hypothetical protein